MSRLVIHAWWSLEELEREACLLSPRTPVLVRCGDCLARFGEALGRDPRPCPRCASLARSPAGRAAMLA